MAENLFTVKQLAFILKVHQLTIRRYIKEENLKAVKVGGSVRIRESDVNSFQTDLNSETKRKVTSREKTERKVFTADDALWRLNGRISSIS